MTTEHSARRHKHLVVRDYLAELIANELEVGDAVPSERTLTERFDVSRMTVRQALDALVAEGTLVREQGRGTFVAPRHADFEMRLTTFGEEARRRGLEPGARVLDATTMPAPPRVARALDLPEDEPVHHVSRLRTADGSPMSIESSWIPARLAPHLLADAVPTSLYSVLRDLDLSPTWGEDTLQAADATATEAELLDMTTQRAVLRTQRRSYAGQTAVMYTQSTFRGDRYSVLVPLREARPMLVPRPSRTPRRGPHATATSPEGVI
ncbi:GntR family transcriptional regulator [Sanguibacter sp. A247]|uniref:GntR family transcriptional regulator n=1 Tax=unclassified Sanguibacter TaxID=2645534 RepID=UPI003FD77CE2